ncbi:MAG TPA: hypothetical protein H9834_00925 [Candidatus Barnesiella excrementavium]|nr:hypothetical protein [Candidatus Barnesiella excrementavium]
MTGNPSTHDSRSPHDWELLIERYYAGETSRREEEELRQYLFSATADPRFDDTRAVLAFTGTGWHLTRPHRQVARRHAWRTWVGAAACIALLLAGGIVYHTTPRDTCVAYVYGEKETNPEVVIRQMQQSVSQFASTDVAVESQLDAIFSPLETLP